MRFLEVLDFNLPICYPHLFFFLSRHSRCPKSEGDVRVWCCYRQSKRKLSTERVLLDLRIWSPFQNFYLKNCWEILQESSGPKGNKVSDSITVLIHIVLAISLETFLTCLQYTWHGNIDVWYENFKSFFCIILEMNITWGETLQSCWVATKFCYVHEG